MTIIRLTNGADIAVKPSVDEVLAQLQRGGFVELDGEEGSIHLRADTVIAVMSDTRRGSAGFRIGITGSAG
jgi:hypothetical protein